MNIIQRQTWGDKLLALTINIIGRTIEVWVALVILNALGIIPK